MMANSVDFWARFAFAVNKPERESLKIVNPNALLERLAELLIPDNQILDPFKFGNERLGNFLTGNVGVVICCVV